MINVSNTIKQACNGDKIAYREYVVLAGTTTPIDVKVEMYSSAYKDTHFIGTFNMKYIKFSTSNDVQYRNKELTLYKEINGESFKVGNFIVTEIKDNDSNEEVSVTAYDYGLKFAQPYQTSLDYASGTVTLKNVLDEICTNVGVELVNETITNGDFIVDSNQFVNGEVYGDVISSIAFISGNFATINEDDKLELIFTKQTNEIIEDYVELDDKRDTHPITSLSIGTSQVGGQNAVAKDDALIAQYGEHWLVINDVPFAYTLEKREQLKTAIFEKIKGFGYSSFKCEYSFKPYMSLGDLVQFRNKDGNLVNSIILKFTSKYDNIILEAPSVTSATIQYENPKTAYDIAKRAEVIVNQNTAEITLLAQEQKDLSNSLIPLDTSNGVELKLEKSAGQPLVEFELEGNCYQESEPTPDNPQEITVIEGDLSLVDEGEQSIETTIDLQGNFIAKLPNGTKDELYLSQGHLYLEQNIGKVVLNGSEVWNFSSSTNVFYGDIANLNYATTNNIPISKYYQGRTNVSGTGELSNNQVAFFNGQSPSRIYIKDTNKSNVSDFKTWLSENNVTVYYELETPVIHDLGEYSIETLKGNSTIRAISNLEPSNMYCKYIRDIEGLDVFQTKNDMADYYNIEATESRISATKGVIELSVENNKKLVDEQGKTINALDKKVTQKINDDGVEFKTIKDTLQNGVETLKNTLVTININGIQVSTNTSKISTIMTNDKFAIQDNTGTYLAYFGYDEEEGRSKAEMDNLTVRQYFTAGYHRTEGFTDEETNEPRTGWFYVGGSI